MAVLGLEWLEVGGMAKKIKLDIAGIVENGWKQIQMAGNCCNRMTWLKIAEKGWNGLTWL